MGTTLNSDQSIAADEFLDEERPGARGGGGAAGTAVGVRWLQQPQVRVSFHFLFHLFIPCFISCFISYSSSINQNQIVLLLDCRNLTVSAAAGKVSFLFLFHVQVSFRFVLCSGFVSFLVECSSFVSFHVQVSFRFLFSQPKSDCINYRFQI